jgi:hypothetical protein
VNLVTGSGKYRPGERTPPTMPIQRLEHWQGRRGSLGSTAFEYWAVNRAFARYLQRNAMPGDLVLVTSAPPTTVFLSRQIRRSGACGIYWLQDFYPQLIRGVWDAPRAVIRLLESIWTRALGSWDRVIKSAANLGYDGSNALVFRNWNTLDLGSPMPTKPRTALYSGNLGYGHDLRAFLALCAELRDEGFEITVRGDGPGMRGLPSWIRSEPPFRNPADLIRSYWEAEVHLVAADSRLTGRSFLPALEFSGGRPTYSSFRICRRDGRRARSSRSSPTFAGIGKRWSPSF